MRAPLFLVAVATTLAACEAGEDGGPSATPDPNEGETFQAVISAAEGGTLATPAGTATAEIPPGALAEDLTLTIAVRPREASTVTSVYELGPEGTTFSLPVRLSVACDLEREGDEAVVLGFDDGGTWTPIPGSLLDDDRVDGVTRHFSAFAGLRVAEEDIMVALPGQGDETTMTYHAWTDASSGLTWQYPTAVRYKTWSEAVSYCEDLYVDGGGWRLPSIGELRSLVRGCPVTEPGGSCGVTDACLEQFECWGDGDECNGCQDGGCLWPDDLFYVGESSCNLGYLSSSPYQTVDPSSGEPDEEADNYVWALDYSYGGILPAPKVDRLKVRCVRGGP